LLAEKCPTSARKWSQKASVFRYAYEANLIGQSVRFGPGFVGPSRRKLRRERQQNGLRMFEAAEIRTMLAAATIPLKAMILLGINCGFGNTYVANLAVKNLDLKGGWCDYPRPRPKTEISRRCPLWPETVKAIKVVLEARPEPCDKADTDLVFLTPAGQRWVWTRGNPADIDVTDMEELARISRADRVTPAVGQLLNKLGLAHRGPGHGRLRHRRKSCSPTDGGASFAGVEGSGTATALSTSNAPGVKPDGENQLAEPSAEIA